MNPGHDFEPIPGFSARQMNNSLRGLYAQLPDDRQHRDMSLSQLSTRKQARVGSEHKTALLNKLDLLLNAAYISPIFREYIIGQFQFDYHSGQNTERLFPEVPNFGFTTEDLLDSSRSDSAGIFDPETAKSIERKAYQSQPARYQYYREQVAREGRPTKYENERAMMELWANAFFQTHGERP